MPILAFQTSLYVPGAPYLVCGAYNRDLVFWVGYGADVVGLELSLSGEHRAQARFRVRGVKNKNNVDNTIHATCDETTGLGDGVAFQHSFETIRPGAQLTAGVYFANRQEYPEMEPSEVFGLLSKASVFLGATQGAEPTSYGALFHSGHAKAGTTVTWRPRRPLKVPMSPSANTGVGVLIDRLSEPCRIDTKLLLRIGAGQ